MFSNALTGVLLAETSFRTQVRLQNSPVQMCE
jgi:hypothetical protein